MNCEDIEKCIITKDFIDGNTDTRCFSSLIAAAKYKHFFSDNYTIGGGGTTNPGRGVTMFVPSDKSLILKYGEDFLHELDTINKHSARCIVESSTVNGRLDSYWFAENKLTVIPTMRNAEYVSLSNACKLNGTAEVLLWDCNLTNGTIHITDGFVNTIF